MLYVTCTTISSVDIAHYGVLKEYIVLKIEYLWIVVQCWVAWFTGYVPYYQFNITMPKIGSKKKISVNKDVQILF